MHSSADAFESSGGRNFSVGLCAILSVFRAVIRPSVAGSDVSLLRCADTCSVRICTFVPVKQVS